MARYSEQELDQLKRSIDLVALVQSKGIKLEKHGKDMKGLCPFHDDKTPSMIITPGKNLFHCPACGTGGDVIAFIQKFDGVSFRHAVELLKNGDQSTLLTSSSKTKMATVRKLEAPVELDVDDQKQLQQTIDYYHQRLLETQPAQDYLKKRGVYCPEAIKTFKLGYADRTLGLRLPHKNRKEGNAIRSSLQKIGLYRESGHEHFNGCLVMPIIDEKEIVTEVYGRKLCDKNKRKGCPTHLYLPGPHVGLWNEQALRAPHRQSLSLTGSESSFKYIILCEALIDALTFWVHGFKNVTSSYGTAGFSKDHLAAFIDHKIERVFIAYDRDEAGDLAAQKLAKELSSEGIQCYRVNFPKGMDANKYASQMTPPAQALKQTLLAATFMDSHLGASPEPRENCHSRQADKGEEVSKAQEKSTPSEAPSIPPVKVGLPPCESEQSSVPEGKPKTSNIPHTQNGEDHLFTLGKRVYRVRGLAKNTSFDVMKINMRLSVGDDMYVDTFDFYNARHRKSFLFAAAEECKTEVDVIKRDLGRLLLKLEELQEANINEILEPEDEKIPEMSEAERAEALELLRSPQLTERIISDFKLSGLVGEDTNGLISYLAATSRKTDDPLAVIIQSSSSAGKSSVMDAALAFMPDEELIRYTSMTGQSLFYMGETSLKHKILAISEEEGAEQAGYALKILQSEKKLKIASTGKDAKTGRLVTQEYNVEGPCVIFMTTTNVEVDEELQNRCLVLTVNEDREQTRRIHELQRKSRTLAGMLRKEHKKDVITLHQNAQRLLRPLLVVNPYAEQLTFLDSRLRTRRDHIKYLNIINAVTLIHQHQREIKSIEHKGEKLEYIEATIHDIEIANKLAADIMGVSLDDLAPQTRKLLEQIHSLAQKKCEEAKVDQRDLRLTRREIRDFTGWGNTRLGIHIQRLIDLEYMTINTIQGRKFVYELLYTGGGQNGEKMVLNLIDTEKLKYEAECTPLNTQCTPHVQGINAPSSPQVQSSLLVASPSKPMEISEIIANSAKKELISGV